MNGLMRVLKRPPSRPAPASTKGGPVQTGFLNGNGSLADKTNMVPGSSWRDHFKIDADILKSFWGDFSQSSPIRASELTEAGAASSLEFVLWCLREGHFSEEAFVQYHSKTYELPVVKASFFETPIDYDFWNRVKDIHPWTSDCVPLADWDGTLLIASVWPFQPFKASLRHRLVLAAPSLLRELHRNLHGKSAAPEVANPQPKQGPKLESEPAPKLEDDSGDPFAALSRAIGLADSNNLDASAATDEASTSEAPEGLVIPEGLSFSSDEISRLNLTTDLPSDVQTESQTDSPELELSMEPEPEPTPALAPEPAPAVVAPPVAPKLVTKSSPPPPPPMMPFAPVVTMEAPAMVRPVVEKVAPKSEPPPLGSEVKVPARPVAEATVVVKADQASFEVPPESMLEEKLEIQTSTPTAPTEAPKARRPLFEPGSTAKPASPATTSKSVSGGAASDSSSRTQTGTGTATRSRRLETTPLTSFFSAGGLAQNPVNAKSALRSAPSPAKYAGSVISINKIEPVHLDQCTSVDEAGAQALLQACNTFETCMILLFKDGVLQPWKWTDLMLSVKGDKPDDIDLREPSIFKVVFRTAKPYHGYVVTSTVNQKFFNEFYRGLLPKHATVIPIMIDGRMGGMILGLTNSKIDYRQSLRLMERLGYDLARVFKMLRGSVAKAS